MSTRQKMLIALTIIITIIFPGCASQVAYQKQIVESGKVIEKKVEKQNVVQSHIDLSKLKPKAEKIKTNGIALSNYEFTRGRIFFSVVKKMENNGKQVILGYINNWSHYILWDTGKKTMQPELVLQPIKNKNFYIIISNLHSDLAAPIVEVYDTDTNYRNNFKGYRLRALKDIDGDGLPEILVTNDDAEEAVLYKIIDTNKQPRVSILTKNRVTWDFARQAWLANFDYYPQESMIVPKGKLEKIEDDYYTKWTKSDIDIVSTKQRMKQGSREAVSMGSFMSTLSDLDRAKITNINPNIIKDYYYHCVMPKNQSRVLVCPFGQKIIKTSDNKYILNIEDSDLGYTDAKFKIKDCNLRVISTPQYMLILDPNTDKLNYWAWKDIIGYQPSFVRYFDGKTLLVVKMSGKKKGTLIVYKMSYVNTDTKQEKW